MPLVKLSSVIRKSATHISQGSHGPEIPFKEQSNVFIFIQEFPINSMTVLQQHED